MILNILWWLWSFCGLFTFLLFNSVDFESHVASNWSQNNHYNDYYLEYHFDLCSYVFNWIISRIFCHSQSDCNHFFAQRISFLILRSVTCQHSTKTANPHLPRVAKVLPGPLVPVVNLNMTSFPSWIIWNYWVFIWKDLECTSSLTSPSCHGISVSQCRWMKYRLTLVVWISSVGMAGCLVVLLTSILCQWPSCHWLWRLKECPFWSWYAPLGTQSQSGMMWISWVRASLFLFSCDSFTTSQDRWAWGNTNADTTKQLTSTHGAREHGNKGAKGAANRKIMETTKRETRSHTWWLSSSFE